MLPFKNVGLGGQPFLDVKDMTEMRVGDGTVSMDRNRLNVENYKTLFFVILLLQLLQAHKLF